MRMVPVPALHISDSRETKTIYLLSILAEASSTEVWKKKTKKQKNKKKHAYI